MDIDGVGGSRVIDKRVRARPEETYLVRHPSNDQKREDIEKFLSGFYFLLLFDCVWIIQKTGETDLILVG